MTPLYRIANWDDFFETDETRKRDTLRWVPVPNKHDGLGYRTVAAQRNATELYAAWVLMLQIASKGRRGARGVLSRDGEPLTVEDMAIMTGFPKEAFARALIFFSQKKVSWIIIESAPELPAETAVGQALTSEASVPAAQSAGAPADDAVPPARDAGQPARKERKEEKGEEDAKGRASLSELQAFCESIGLTRSDGESRFHAWEANGWRINGKPMKCWQSAIRSWKAAGYMPSQKQAPLGSNGHATVTKIAHPDDLYAQ